MTPVVIESRVVVSVSGGCFLDGSPPGPGSGKWTLYIGKYPLQSWGYAVWGQHHETGAIVPTEASDDGSGWVGSVHHAKTLATARDRAGQVATVIRGTMHEYNWRAES